MTRDDLQAALQEPNLQGFLRVIRAGETSQEDSAYTELFGGGHFDAPPWEHPSTAVVRGALKSTAAGAYQFLASTWGDVVKALGPMDFSPANQDLGAAFLINRRGALQDAISGDLASAISKCNREWASLPGSPYGQPTRTLEQAQAVFLQYGGQSSTVKSLVTQGVKPMPVFMALLPQLLGMIPQLGQLFGSGTEVSNRNVAAASVVADTIVKATQSTNVQAAVEAMQNDPAVLSAAKEALDAVWPSIVESGGGGIGQARKDAAAPEQIPFYKNPAFVVTMALAPLLYMVAAAVLFGIGGQTWSDDVKTMVVTAIVSGLLGSITGFFLGSSLGSQKKDAALGAR